MDLTIVPYGNAQMTGDTVSCQHGPDECQGNAIEQCPFNLYDVYTAFPFYLCMEQAGNNMLNEVQDCATSASLSYDKLADCFNNATTVTANQKAAAAATPADHTYTPWVVVDGDRDGGKLAPGDGLRGLRGRRPGRLPDPHQAPARRRRGP